ncbi:hypothetical protein AALP_AA6G203100 [Arabis alpina]|uniref:Uncharacterized protein n=1 Tax=Arabis alpina TaxID=50452 RepID=A0A087GQI6_ARAAL|nr:hypothetical protein AALP_AA6G203100 [Arabis alpina]
MTSVPMTTSVRARSLMASALKTPDGPTLHPPPPLTPDEFAVQHKLSEKRARFSSGKGKGIDFGTPTKRERVDAYSAVVVEIEASASRAAAPSVIGLLRDEAYAATKSKASELSLLFDRLVGDYDEDVRSRDREHSVAKEANAVLKSKLAELTKRNLVLERDALTMQKIKKDCDTKLAKVKSRCTKGEDYIASLRQQLSSASDLQSTRIGEVVAEARDEMARGFAERVNEVVGLLAEIGGKAQNNMLNLAEIESNLDFIGLLQGPMPPDLPTEVKIPEVSAAAVEADDNVEVGATNGDDAEVTDDEDGDEEIED